MEQATARLTDLEGKVAASTSKLSEVEKQVDAKRSELSEIEAGLRRLQLRLVG